MTALLGLCADVYQATDAWSFGASRGPVLAAEAQLRAALDAMPAGDSEHPVVAAARRVHAVGGFRFDRPSGGELAAAEAAWGDAVRAWSAS